MRIRIAIVIAVLASSEILAAQKTSDELAELRQILGVPASTPITKAKASALPTERPLRIYISMATDPDARNPVHRLIREINEKDARKYGTAAVVQSLSEANLILLHYELPSKRLQEAEPAMAIDPIGGEVTHRITTEVVGYVVARSTAGLIILDQYSRRVTLHTPRTELRDAFLKVLKAAGKGQQK